MYLNDLYFFVAVENLNIGDAAKRFSTGFSFKDLIDQHWRYPRASEEEEEPDGDDEKKPEDGVPLYKPFAAADDGIPDTVSITYPDGFTPFNNRNSWHVNATLQYVRTPFTFDLTLLYNREKAYANNRPMLEILNPRQDYMQYNKWLVGLSMTHEMSRQMSYDIRFGYYDNHSEKYDAFFGNDWKLWEDSAAVARATNGDVIYQSKFSSGPWPYYLYGFIFYPNGTAPGNYEKNVQNYWSVATDWRWQPAKAHRLTFGAEYRKYNIRQYSIDPGLMYYTSTYDPWPDYPDYNFLGNTYGYDLFGEENEEGINGPRRPVFGAGYLEDQIQYKNIILNLGLRYDYLKSGAYTLKNLNNPKIDLNTRLIADSEWYIRGPIQQLSPRISMTWSPDPAINYYWNYGSFIQLPRFNQYFYNTYEYTKQIVWGGYYYYQPIGFAPDPVYTKMTEVGVNYVASEIVSVHLAAYLKMTNGLTRTEQEPDYWGAPYAWWSSRRYLKLENGDRSITKGLEFAMSLNRYKRFAAIMRYTLSSAEGTGSNGIAYYHAVYLGTPVPTIDSPLDFNYTHSGSVMLDYRFSKGEGGIFASSGINLLSRFSSGHPYTYSNFSCG